MHLFILFNSLEELDTGLLLFYAYQCSHVAFLKSLYMFAFVGKCGLTNTDIVFVVDSSSKVKRKDFATILEFCKDLIVDADIESGTVKVGMVVFSSKAKVQFELGMYQTKAELIEAVEAAPKLRGKLNIADAIQTATVMLRNSRSSTVESAMFLITSGESNIKKRRTLREAKRAKSLGINIYGVGVGLSDTGELDSITSSSQTRFSIPSFEDLNDLSEILFLPKCKGKEARPITKIMRKYLFLYTK